MEGTRRIVASPIPRCEITQIGFSNNLRYDLSFLGENFITYQNSVIVIATINTILNLLKEIMNYKYSEVNLSLIGGSVGYNDDIAVRVRVGYMNQAQYKWFMENLAYVAEIPDNKWTLMWHGWGYGKAYFNSEVGITFKGKAGGAIITEIIPAAGKELFHHLYLVSDVIRRLR